jgi:membrane-bound ClpP family serine protease
MTGMFFITLLLFVFGMAILLAACDVGDGVGALLGIIIVAVSIVLFCNSEMERETDVKLPLRHEVRFTESGYVLDATKYNIVEQRGQIYVIEERK